MKSLGLIVETCMSGIKIFIILNLVSRAFGNPVVQVDSINEPIESITNATQSDAVDYSTTILHCQKKMLHDKDVHFFKNGHIFIIAYNTTVKPSKLNIVENGDVICFTPSDKVRKKIFNNCQKWLYVKSEFEKLSNGSVSLFGELLEPGMYEITKEGKLATCFFDDDFVDDNVTYPGAYPEHMTDATANSIYIGKIGSAISILALSANLITFCMVPTLRNLPGYNLISLSVAYLMAYLFLFIGQIPEVLGLFCVISGVLQQYFFLVAFFIMNVMSFDVWKTLRMATKQLAVRTEYTRKWQFLLYSLYAWLIPLAITIASVVVDNIDNVPERIRPQYGRGDICWMTNNLAKAIFFSIPAFTLFFVNAVLFSLSAIILKRNTMKHTNEQHRQTAKMNLVLYLRLALMMGITWFTGVVAIVSGVSAIWYIFDVLNSLQGLFVFLLFTCSRKVFVHIRDKMNATNSKATSEKNDATFSTKFDSK